MLDGGIGSAVGFQRLRISTIQLFFNRTENDDENDLRKNSKRKGEKKPNEDGVAKLYSFIGEERASDPKKAMKAETTRSIVEP